MIISRVIEEESGRVGDGERQTLDDNSTEFQTSQDIYQIMSKNNVFEGDGDKALTTRDLVILYKNIDINAKPVATTDRQTVKSPNQYVETVKYNDDQDSEASDDVSEVISNEDFKQVFAINEERIDLLNNFGDTLCHKLGNMQMRTSDLATEYDKHFLFNDPFIKEQLKSFHRIAKAKQSDSTVLPASLLDYICCKRIEDNYNFYMDNIIKYVQNTIEQLKRISNGDYLTDKVKEKWREVYDENIPEETPQRKNIVLTSSVSIPLRVNDKHTDQRITWDDIVHSEIDVRSLSKVLEKRVILEVPNIICGTFKLFSKRCNDNLIITCTKDKEKDDSRVDVVLKLQRSKSGHVVSNIDSIMILKSTPTNATESESQSKDLLAIEYEMVNSLEPKEEQRPEIIQLCGNIGESHTAELNDNIDGVHANETADCSLAGDRETETEKFSEDDYDIAQLSDRQGDSESSYSKRAEADFNTIANDDLHSVIHRLRMQTPVLEENEDNMKKRKSPVRVRIKSPYENNSFVIEEKKRKKLLEIRDKREIKKNAISENCKIMKHRYGRGVITVQASNSVTKLSITNKHFYNSIYGHSININQKISQKYHKDHKRYNVPEIELEEVAKICHSGCPPSPLVSPERNNQKYINRSYYLDEADTEVMYLQKKENENQAFSASPTAKEIGVNLNLLEQLIGPSTTDFSLTDTSSSVQHNILCDDRFLNTEEEIPQKAILMSTRSTQVSVSTDSKKLEVFTQDDYSKTTSSVECRRSIDKIYNLLKQIGKTDSLEVIPTQSKVDNNIDKVQMQCGRGASSIQASDSGTSMKHQLTSSNLSCCSFEKTDTVLKSTKGSKKKYDNTTPVIPKVTISSKQPNIKINDKANTKESKKLSFSKIQDNPLKAISQLIHEFDNVQKSIAKNEKHKKIELLTSQDKSSPRQNVVKRTLKQEMNLKDSEINSSKNLIVKERRRQGMGTTPVDSSNRKNIIDIIDEVKELRGEAVRGPSKKLSRINSLAQPKKTVQKSQLEEPQNKFGKRVIDRLTRPTPTVSNTEKSIVSTKTRPKKISDGQATIIKQPPTTGSLLDRTSRIKPVAHNSPNRDSNKRYLGPAGKPSINHGNVKSPEQLKGKMVAVESYVKSHYGRNSHPLAISDSYNAPKSRVPLIPNDLDVVSMTSSPSTKEESTTLGKKLHYMINTVVGSTIPVLDAVAECKESVSKADDGLDAMSMKKNSRSNEIILSGSDFPVDIFEDKNIVTAVSVIRQDQNDEQMVNDNNSNTNDCTIETSNIPNDLNYGENAICRQLSNGSFQKSLKIKKLPLNITSKQSKENVLILKSEVSNSLVLKSKLSQHIDLNPETIRELRILPALSKNCFTDFSFTNFPMQIATIGYALPHVGIAHDCDSKTKISLLQNDDIRSETVKIATSCEKLTNTTLCNSVQCLKETVKNSETEIKTKSIDCILADEVKNEVVLEPHTDLFDTEQCEQNTKHEMCATKTIDDAIARKINSNKNISNSTSLDILVGLLNEIKKITSYQAQMPKKMNSCDTDYENKELEVLLNNLSVNESSVEHSVDNAMSQSSFDNLQVLEARASNFVYLSSNKEEKKTSDKNVTTNTSLVSGSLNVGKELNSKILQTQCTHSEAVSLILPISVSTNVTDSLMKLINKSSSRSIYSITDCESFASLANEIKDVYTKSSEKCISSVGPTNLKIQYINETKKYSDLKDENHALVEFDPVMKMKRDILVTVYSILVFTVFAALSFPQIMYRG